MKPIVATAAEMTCPRCGARQVRIVDECWLCGTSRGDDGLLGSGRRGNKLSFSLGTLLWINTFVACCCALAVSLPGVGTIFGLMLFVVATRTLLVLKRRRDRGMVTSLWKKLSLFAWSVLRTTLLMIFAFLSLMEFLLVAVVILFLAAQGLFSNAMLVSILGALMTVALWLLAIMVTGVEKRFHRDTSRRAS
jgi:magnesium-transporting ATPase (P-type)